MKLTLKTDYALRILMALARDQSRVVSIEELANEFGVSKNHLMKAAQGLASGGFVRSYRGRTGGLALAREPKHISVAAVVQHIEPDFHIAECFHKSTCSFLPQCRLRAALASARAAFLAILAEKTLADVSVH
jgi:Rrf2 family nitric oxide-sensitive transcriptional repressor